MSHKMRSSKLCKPEASRVCGCGKPCRPHTFFCGDECRFWAKVNKGPGCWLWTGSLSGSCVRHGKRTEAKYGQFTISTSGKQQHLGAHVFSFALAFGPIPEGAFILHRCDVPRCVRPDHLFLGDHKANMEDAAAKGRLHSPRPTAQKVTPEQIADIRARVTAGERRSRVAADYGISKTLVTLLMAGDRRQYDAPIQPQTVEKAS